MQLSSFVNRDELADFIHRVTGIDVQLRLDAVGVPVPLQDVIYERHLSAIEAAFVAGVAVASQPHRYLLAGIRGWRCRCQPAAPVSVGWH